MQLSPGGFPSHSALSPSSLWSSLGIQAQTYLPSCRAAALYASKSKGPETEKIEKLSWAGRLGLARVAVYLWPHNGTWI